MSKMQVWGLRLHGSLDGYHGQLRVIVAVPSRIAAVRALKAAGFNNVSDNYLKDYGGITGNETEVAVATAQPGVVFAVKDQGTLRERETYVEVKR